MKPIATKRIVSMILLAVVVFGVGLLMLTGADDNFDTTTEDISDNSYLSLKTDSLYRIEDLTVLDMYGELNEGDVKYFVVTFQDANEHTVITSLSVNPDSPLWKPMKDYLRNDEDAIGSLTFDGYFETQAFNSELENHRQLYNESINQLKLYGYLTSGAKRSDFSLVYVCDLDEDPTTTNAGAAKVAKVVGTVMLVLSGWMVFVAVKWMIRNKKARQSVSTAPIAPAARVTPITPAAPENEIKAELDRYNELVKAGYMTHEEFEQKRKELLKL